MPLERRVTLRCLTEDLHTDWGVADHKRAVVELSSRAERVASGNATDSHVAEVLERLPELNRLDHPIVRHFDEAFAGDVDVRESITGLKDPHWWKQKTNRWRGAATDHAVVDAGSVWLCAAGLRAGGERTKDFYARFVDRIQRVGAASVLPTDADRVVSRTSGKLNAISAWSLQVQVTVLTLLHAAKNHNAGGASVTIPAPSRSGDGAASVEVSLDLAIEEVDGDEMVECLLTVTALGHENGRWAEEVAFKARGILNPDAALWRLSVTGDTSITHSAMLDDAVFSLASDVAAGEPLTAAASQGLRLGTVAHYSPREQLTDATVDGVAVPALCGYWFVPMRDHEGLEVCPTCAAAHASLA